MTIPPLLLLAQGRKPRLRRSPAPRPKEIVLHMSVAKVLREHARSDWQWCHVPTGEIRDKRTASKLKQMGAKAGWPDFLLIQPRGRLHCLELKRAGEKLSEAQDAFRMWCVRHGIPHVVAFSIDDVLIAFEAWDCLSIKIAKQRTDESLLSKGGGE
ncbi:VRR-NUC domain-containing protein [Methylocapsa palsarum]|uniref:VRR-NUC domain-containing protein n=1 Tax=Methylocapsa palsarum TaxID=1612308 RepID=A0A1I4CRZ9_9HYPH|nr:VRR-NUC domain-containing protein [Methylocapsa palsarum]SFK83400.1 VRR-NUC domain-containing protein [Methylocapsa palsarum]